MKKVKKTVGTQSGVLGELEFPILESIEEAVATYGDRQTLSLLQRALNIDVERIGRDNLKKDKKVEEVQALIDAYKPGQRGSGKPTMKNYVDLLTRFGEAEEIDEMLASQKIYTAEGLEAAVGYMKQKAEEMGI